MSVGTTTPTPPGHRPIPRHSSPSSSRRLLLRRRLHLTESQHSIIQNENGTISDSNDLHRQQDRQRHLRLTIPGSTPETGVLLVNSQGGDQVLRDNHVSYTPSGSKWIIKSHTAPGTSVINLNSYGRVFSFAFFSAAKPIEVTTCLDENDASRETPEPARSCLREW